MSYQRLGSEERFLIGRSHSGSKRVRAIARLLGRAASTVSRELGRNGSIVGRQRHELRSMANRYDEDSDSAHQEAVHRRPGIGPYLISEVAEDLVERSSSLIKLECLSSRPATTVTKAIWALMKGHMVRVRSITADYGQEFAAHVARSRKINAPFFFADRNRFWQRGRVENADWLGASFHPEEN